MDSFRHGDPHDAWPGNGAWIRGASVLYGVLIVLGLAAWFPGAGARALQPGRGSGQGQAGSSQQSGLTFEYPKSVVSFGNVAVGAVATQQLTITNSGPTSLVLSTSHVFGNAFSVTRLGLPVTLGPGQSLSFTARFSPTVTGSFIGSVIFEGAGSQKYTTLLRGTGGASTSILTSPAHIDFGNVVVGGDAQLPVLIHNTGASSVTISSASVSGTGYTLSNLNLPVTLNGGQSTSFIVTFAPTGLGASEGTASLITSADNSPDTFSLTGTGLARSGHYVRLTWTDSTSPGVLEYAIYRGTISGGPYSEVATVSGSGTSYVDHKVAAGETYYYVATAVTGTGQSVYSNEATAQIP